jgi:hypothetical protein
MNAMTGFVATVGARPRRALCIPGMNAGVFRASWITAGKLCTLLSFTAGWLTQDH